MALARAFLKSSRGNELEIAHASCCTALSRRSIVQYLPAIGYYSESCIGATIPDSRKHFGSGMLRSKILPADAS
eukprot:scaffold269606_cov27-Tisochrysis_lutea.AAC.2